MKSPNLPLRAKLEGRQLVIRVGVETLAWAFEHAPENNPWDEATDRYVQSLRVIDPVIFAKDVCFSINREEEDGSSPLTEFLDKSCREAVDNGSIGVCECPYPSTLK